MTIFHEMLLCWTLNLVAEWFSKEISYLVNMYWLCFDKSITSELSKMSSFNRDYNLQITDDYGMPLQLNILTEH